MLWPLYVLAAGALFAGLAFKDFFIGAGFAEFFRSFIAKDNTSEAMHHVPHWVAMAPSS
jgi:NADH-quinone oxidoreductase subunit L